jgi:hypothetical protein
MLIGHLGAQISFSQDSEELSQGKEYAGALPKSYLHLQSKKPNSLGSSNRAPRIVKNY